LRTPRRGSPRGRWPSTRWFSIAPFTPPTNPLLQELSLAAFDGACRGTPSRRVRAAALKCQQVAGNRGQTPTPAGASWTRIGVRPRFPRRFCSPT
jgi:hypothetical protein